MVKVDFDDAFKKGIEKIKDGLLKIKVKKQIKKIIELPEIGKPMRYERKDTREVYLPPFRISYKYHKQENRIEFLTVYHKDEQ
jgi:mRNA-degrading endonuclease RelE of RelBE toxin-antitoxin system